MFHWLSVELPPVRAASRSARRCLSAAGRQRFRLAASSVRSVARRAWRASAWCRPASRAGVGGVGRVARGPQPGEVGLGFGRGGDQLGVGEHRGDLGARPVELLEPFGLLLQLGGRADRRAGVVEPEEPGLDDGGQGPLLGGRELGRGGPLLPGGLDRLPEQVGLFGQPFQPGGQGRVLPPGLVDATGQLLGVGGEPFDVRTAGGEGDRELA